MNSPVKIWRNQKKIKELLGKEGVIISWTQVRVPLAGFEEQAPYYVVLVRLADRNYLGQLVDVTGIVATGQKVKAVIRRLRRPEAEDVIPYGIKFVLLA
ncbi:TPA: hypothetical protein DIV55_05605 [Patescibacteria group bacterium]|uniref:ChsH2 C-terminal OB-fold domain-containing protein n=1 Tax=Candidatus Gottesmanbacteria bacterium GW2011_GWA1_43_11 TaxID=1618436 RepID=A0A0G1ELK1_9BACT|nr:MAG: hypothetical protein UV59_C0029G0003 [Candidatus Gottesmanbacteria bacterium GW2011_GWA1_43_11]HCS79184.1 hypothetical protein [Patescibacteria group bacterium]